MDLVTPDFVLVLVLEKSDYEDEDENEDDAELFPLHQLERLCRSFRCSVEPATIVRRVWQTWR